MDSFEFEIKSNVVNSNSQPYFEKHYHNSTFHTFPHNNLNNGINSGSVTTPTGSTSSFSTLIHQQHPLSSFHTNSHTSTMPPPLIHYNQQPQHQSVTHQQQAASKSSKLGDSQQIITNSVAESAVSKVKSEENSQNPPDEIVEQVEETVEATEEADEPEIDIVINNVVCAFNVRCTLALKEIALHGANVEYKRENGMVTMKLRKPYTTASIWSSGKITCTGATSEDQARVAARRYARLLQKLNFRVRFQNYRVVNVLGTCKMPFAIKIVQFSEKYKKEASYEPELHPGVTYNLKTPKATLKIFSTGSMTVTAASVAHVQAAIEHIYPLVYEFKKPRAQEQVPNAEVESHILESDMDDDDDEDDMDDFETVEDPLALDEPDEQPPNKKQKLRDISHLQKKYRGPPPSGKKNNQQRRGKRPLGKMNDPKQDSIYVSDGEIDGDDF